MKKRNIRKFLYAITALILAILSLFVITDKLTRDIIINNIESAAANKFIDITNKAVAKVLDIYNLKYNELSNLQIDSNGNVVSISCDTVKLMQIKTIIDDEIQNCISKEPTIKFSIALGSFLSNEYFAGRGPKIPFEFTYDCATIAEYKSEFYDAGINQTIHRIVLHLSADIATVIPWNYEKTTVNTTYIIAETVIVGKIPSSYTNLDLNKN